MVWTRARLGLPEGIAEAPSAAPRTTAPHDITKGVAPFAHGSCGQQVPDTMALLVYANIQGPTPRGMSDSAWAVYRDEVQFALGRASDLPNAAVLPTFGVPAPRGSPQSIPTVKVKGRLDVVPLLSTVVSFTLDTMGAIKDHHIAASTLSAAADTSVMAMVEQAAASNVFPRVAGQHASSDSLQLYLVVEAVEPSAGTQGTVLGQLEVPVWRLARAPRLVSGAPREDHKGGARDSIAVTIVVDSTGQVPNGTARFEVTEAPGALVPASQTRVLQILPSLRFEPAMIGSCHVSALVTESFATSDLATQ
jgi:hypothetical protein